MNTATRIHHYDRHWDVDAVRVIDCKSCGFIHVYPVPLQEELQEFYENQYYTNVKPFDYDSVSEQLIANKKNEVKQHGGYKAIFNRVSRMISEFGASTLQMLDVGCGNDLLAAYFKENHWDASVIEPSKDAAAYLRKFDLTVHEQLADDIETLGLSDLSFVNIQFVLEHIADPRSLLEKVYQAMSPGGVLRICVPNDFSTGQTVYQEYYNEKLRWVVQPDHINYFSFTSLSNLLQKCGFDEMYRTTNFPLEFLLLGGYNFYADESAAKQVGPFVDNFTNAFMKTGNWSKLSKLYEALAQLEMGRSIYMFAQKRS